MHGGAFHFSSPEKIYLFNFTIDNFYFIRLISTIILNIREIFPIKDWKELTDLTKGARILVERVLLPDSGIAIEGEFEPPVLARLSAEDQVFVIAFVQVHGSIKEMERIFGISYPTVKNRLNRISGQLQLVETVRRTGGPAGTQRNPESAAVLDSLESGEIDVEVAVRRLSG